MLALESRFSSTFIYMRLLYKAYGCENLGEGKFLLPGYPIEATSKPVQAGERICVELGNGEILNTTVLSTKPFIFDESIIAKLRIRAKPGMYYAIQVPNDFSPTAVDFGVTVYMEN
jgi:hypothetical protein